MCWRRYKSVVTLMVFCILAPRSASYWVPSQALLPHILRRTICFAPECLAHLQSRSLPPLLSLVRYLPTQQSKSCTWDASCVELILILLGPDAALSFPTRTCNSLNNSSLRFVSVQQQLSVPKLQSSLSTGTSSVQVAPWQAATFQTRRLRVPSMC